MDEVDMAEQGADLMEVQPEAELPDATRGQVIENKDQHLMEKATKTIQEVCSLLTDKLESTKDAKMAEGVLKFADRMKLLAKSMHGNLTSALYNFGALELKKGKNGKKIKVQPNRKRKSGSGSRQAVAKGRSVNLTTLKIPAKKPKRSHNLALAIRENTNVSKKSGAHVMHSRTRHVRQ